MGGREATKQPRTVLPSTHRCSVGPLSCAMASPSGARLPQHVLLHVLGNNQGVVDNSADRKRERRDIKDVDLPGYVLHHYETHCLCQMAYHYLSLFSFDV